MVATNAFDPPGIILGINPGFGTELVRVSHASIKQLHYDPVGDRQADIFIGGINSTASAGYFMAGVMPTALQRSTDDPAWLASRDLWSATVPAIQEHPPSAMEFRLPPHLTAEQVCKPVLAFGTSIYWSIFLNGVKFAPDEVIDTVGFNFFRQIFGINPTQADMEMIREWTGMVGGLEASSPTEAGAARSLELATIITNKIAHSKFGSKFLDEAERRNLNSAHELRGMVFAFIFAGYGAPGSSRMAFQIVQKILADPRTNVPLYLKDPSGFIMEFVRFYGGGGGGISNYKTGQTTTWTLGSGHVITEPKGTVSSTAIWPSAWDPNVWGGPNKDIEYAKQFIPGRDNADRMLTWLAELRDIRKCPNMTGCTKAPRFCPGAWLSQRLSRQFVDFVVNNCINTKKNDEI